MRLGRQVVNDLTLVEQHQHQRAGTDSGQRPIVGAAAAAEAYSVSRSSEPGSDHEIGHRDRVETQSRPVRLGQAAVRGCEMSIVSGPIQIKIISQYG